VTFQLSLDLTDIDRAVELARLGVGAGIQVLEAGTILILSEGARHVLPRLRSEFPSVPLVADIKCTDGVGYETALAYDLGATAATVMSSASDASIRCAVTEAMSRPGCHVMVDTMGAGGPDGRRAQGHVDSARRARDLGADYAVIHLGYDERGADPAMVADDVLLRWADAVARAELGIRLQVVGGLTLAQAELLPAMGISDVVISMNLGAAPAGDLRYDQVTAFSVDLDDTADRETVSLQLQRFVEKVSGITS
jgi:3-hexulose-6-phosphate synthase